LLKKGLAVGIILLFISSGIIPVVISDNPISTKTIYVDDDNVDGPWDGSQEHPYRMIQHAVDNSYNGDTVFVYNGIYAEFILINKSIDLLGENKESTIIGGENQIRKHRIIIDEDEVKINGFTIQDSGNGCFGIYAQENNFEISNNIVKDNGYGIWISGKGSVFNNTIMRNQKGISSRSNNNSIYNNLIADNNKGIEVFGDFCTYTKNRFLDNSIALLLLHANSNIISDNQIENNNEAITVSNSDDNEVTKNNFINNKEHTYLEKGCRLKDFKHVRKYKNSWDNNYWDDWKIKTPKPIRGRFGIHIEFSFIRMGIPIALFPFF